MAYIPAPISNVLQRVTSLVNAAEWISFNASTTVSTTLTSLYGSQPFTNTTRDAGKILVVKGAGAAGIDLVTTVATVSNVNVAVMAAAAAAVIASTPVAMGGAFNDDRHTYQEIIEAIFEADQRVCLTIAETMGHWARPDLLILSGSIASGSPIPSHTSVPAEVLVQKVTAGAYLPGARADLQDIANWNANTGTAPNDVYGTLGPAAAGSALSGYCNVDNDGYLYYTGADAKIRLFQYTRTTALQAPNVYEDAVVSGALSTLYLKDGEDVTAANTWGQMYQMTLAAIKGN